MLKRNEHLTITDKSITLVVEFCKFKRYSFSISEVCAYDKRNISLLWTFLEVLQANLKLRVSNMLNKLERMQPEEKWQYLQTQYPMFRRIKHTNEHLNKIIEGLKKCLNT